MKNTMLENIKIEEEKKEKEKFSVNDLAAFRIVQEENKQLKELLKKYITQASSFPWFLLFLRQ